MAFLLRELVVVKLKPHPVVNFVVFQGDVVLVYVVPLLNAELFRPRACLRGDEFLQVTDGVVLVALDADLLSLRRKGRTLDDGEREGWV